MGHYRLYQCFHWFITSNQLQDVQGVLTVLLHGQQKAKQTLGRNLRDKDHDNSLSDVSQNMSLPKQHIGLPDIASKHWSLSIIFCFKAIREKLKTELSRINFNYVNLPPS